MARIFIDVHPDGTFTSSRYHGDPVAHAANQERGVVTYMTEDLGPLDDLAASFNRYIHGGGHFVRGIYITGDWKQWGAFCIRKWGAWFERVEGYKRRARMPLKQEAAELRIKAVLLSNGELGLGTIKNRLRSLPAPQLLDCLANLVKRGDVIEHRYDHPINKVPTASYRLFDTSSTGL